MILVIDNYDSFTYNLVQLLGTLHERIEVQRNDAITSSGVLARNPDYLILSPGPGTPSQSGNLLDIVTVCGPRMPTLGVCLGHQAIGHAFGGEVVRAGRIMHGKTSPIHHNGKELFAGLSNPFEATRYHSLVVRRETLPDSLRITAETPDGLIMALSHESLPVHGVQFHPESITSQHGHKILRNFLDLAREWNDSRPPRAKVA